MDLTTTSLQDSSEDSGYVTKTKSQTVIDMDNTATSIVSHYPETPETSTSSTVNDSTSRKRKFSQICSTFILNESLYENFYKSSVVDITKPSTYLLSSTLNDSLSKSLERCYLEERPLKKHKCKEDSPEYQPKTRSAPSTPTKHFDYDDSNVIEKSLSENLGYHSRSDKKRSGYHRTPRLGSPERLELLYPILKPTPTPPKLKTPEKLREFMRKINSSAKKKLFQHSLGNEKRVVRKVDTDLVSVFLIKNDFRHIVAKIFDFLSEGDLCSVFKVSKSWKKALMADSKAYLRYYNYTYKFNINKENYTPTSTYKLKVSPPDSPDRDSFTRYRRVAAQLLPGQSLQKCPQCMKPAVIERSIGQCQNLNCGYIYCIKCLSFSTTGPEDFVDKCNTSELVLDTKAKCFGLQDLSNMDKEIPSFLLDNKGSFTPQSTCDSSGYVSEPEISPIAKGNLSLSKTNLNILQNYNRQCETRVSLKTRRCSLLTSVTPSSIPKVVEVIEPSSPPKIKLVACSKQSKRNLKRLQF